MQTMDVHTMVPLGMMKNSISPFASGVIGCSQMQQIYLIIIVHLSYGGVLGL